MMKMQMMFAVAAVALQLTAFGAIRAVTPTAWNGKPDSAQMKRHQEKMELVRKGGSKVVFIGDWAVWVWLARPVWDRTFGGEPEEVAQGIRRILDIIAKKQPHAKVLLLPIFPSGPSEEGKHRVQTRQVNAEIAKFADGKKVIWVDFNDKFLDEKGDVLWCMPDRLHPNAAAYRDIWMPAGSAALQEDLREVSRGIFGLGCDIIAS